MTDIVLSVQKTAQEFLGNLEKIDVTSVKLIIEGLASDSLTESDKQHAVEAVNDWERITIQRIEDKVRTISDFLGQINDRRRCVLLSRDTYQDTSFMNQDFFYLLKGLARDVNLTQLFDETVDYINELKTKVISVGRMEFKSQHDMFLHTRAEQVNNYRIMKMLLVADLRLRDEMTKHPDIVSFLKSLKDLKRNMTKTKKSITSMANIARINVTASSPENRESLIKLYKTLSV